MVLRPLLVHADGLLRGSGAFHPARAAELPAWTFPLITLAFAPLYGALMGSFHFDSAERIRQVAYSGIKMPLLLFASTLVCLPGFFVLNTVLGLREDFRQSVKAILAGQAGLGVIVASLGPLTRFFYFCTSDYRAALLFNLAALAVSTVAGQFVMLRYYRVLIRRNRRHRLMLLAWLGLYAFVGIQMAWMLRPFVGDPTMRVSFFRAEPFSNAYVVVFRLIFRR
ncbi:MAG TPA: hypothetical protein VGM03_12870 [Phycisphaerae bacterium]|jgi:hypothetical protein